MSHSSNQTATVFFFHTHFFSPNVTQFSRQATICTAFYFTFSSMSLVCFIYKIIFFTCIIYPGLTLFTYINNSLFCFNFLFSFRNKLSLVSIYLPRLTYTLQLLRFCLKLAKWVSVNGERERRAPQTFWQYAQDSRRYEYGKQRGISIILRHFCY